MSIRVDSSPLIPGSVVVGTPGLGVLGSDIPSTGDSGPGYAYEDLIAGDDTKEIRGLIVSWPTNGTLRAYEDTSFTYDGSSDTFQYQLYVDGVSRGSVVTHTLLIGVYDVALAGITSSESFGSLSASTSSAAEISLSGIQSGESFGSMLVSLGQTSSIVLSSISSGESFGSMTVSVDGTSSVSLYGIASGESFGTMYIDIPASSIRLTGKRRLSKNLAYGDV